MSKKVLIVMGSRSDLPAMEGCMKQLDEFGMEYQVRVLSAHRTPEAVLKVSSEAKENGFGVIIAAAGGAAHLAGVIASSTPLPVIGIPMKSGLNGLDSLLSIVQMPSGVPVATVAIGKAGCKNAALLALEIMGVYDKDIHDKLIVYKQNMKEKVLASTID